MIDPFELSKSELIILALIAVFIIIFAEVSAKIIMRHVKRTSAVCQKLIKLNDMYDFYSAEEKKTFYARVRTKTGLDRFNYDRFVEECIEKDIYYYGLCVTKAERNARLFEEYMTEADGILDSENRKGLAGFIYRKAARELLLRPVTEPVFEVIVKYESPKGKRLYTDKKSYSLEEFAERYRAAVFVSDAKEGAEYARRKMTDSLRYDILKRDNFHCVLCGRGPEDGVKLEVDHIIPVSKGGATVRENLRTLCRECNAGKSDKFDKRGLN